MASHNGSRFSVELARSMTASRKTPEALVGELDEAGFTVPEHAVRNWLKGYFLPRSEAAGEVVSAIEQLLGIEPTRLVQSLALDIASGRAFVPGEDRDAYTSMSVPEADEVFDRKFGDTDRVTDWQAELVRVAIEDHITLSPDLRDMRNVVVTWGRVPAAPNPTLHVPVVYDITDIPTNRLLLHSIEGARLAGQKVFEKESGMVNITSRLLLPDDAEPGDLWRVSFTDDSTRSEDINRASERYFQWPLEKYTVRVTFEGEAPEGIEYVFARALGNGRLAEETTTPLELHGDTVEHVEENVRRGIGWVQWA